MNHSQHDQVGSGTHAPPPPPTAAGHFLHGAPGFAWTRQGPPISGLPTELLLEIFRMIHPTDREPRGALSYIGKQQEPADLLPVMHTCKAWQDLIRRTPAFWCNIVINNHSWEWFALCLDHSQQRLIHIAFHAPMSITVLTRILRNLDPHKGRIEDLWFKSVDCAQLRGNCGIAWPSMANLKSLRISVDHTGHEAHGNRHDGCCPVLLLPKSSCSELEELELEGLTIRGPYIKSAFSELRELHLTGCADGRTRKLHRLSDFMQMLKTCQYLYELELGLHMLDTFSVDMGQAQDIVALPRLRELTIYGRTEEVSILLSNLKLSPHVTYLMLGTEEFGVADIARAEGAVRAILPNDLVRCGLPVLRRVDRVKIDLVGVVDEEVMIITAMRGPSDDVRTSIVLRIPLADKESWTGAGSEEARARYYRGALRLLPEMFPNAPLETFVCRGNLDAVNQEDAWRSLFSYYPLLKTLVVEDSEWFGNVTPVLNALTHLQPDGFDGERPLCPQLEYLWIHGSLGELNRIEEIRKYIAWRSACRAPVKRLRLELPVKLKELPDVSAYREEFGRLVKESSLLVLRPRKVAADHVFMRQRDSELEIRFY